MMGNREKFKQLVAQEPTNSLERTKQRVKNRAILRASSKIAMDILFKLDELGWTQKKLAELLEVSPQQVNKIVRGGENLTLETIVKLEEVLELQILYKERNQNAGEGKLISSIGRLETKEL
jgi:ribosome-binding protein aMBF1 (putative translation factor)